jgi:hypothetical protein
MMRNKLRATAPIRVLVLATFVLTAVACSGSDDVAAVDGTVPATPTTVISAGAHNGGGGEYSVLMLANTDELTAASTLESLRDAGIDGFVMEGTDDGAFDLYHPGLTYEEATDLVVEIFATPDVNGGLIYETANLP